MQWNTRVCIDNSPSREGMDSSAVAIRFLSSLGAIPGCLPIYRSTALQPLLEKYRFGAKMRHFIGSSFLKAGWCYLQTSVDLVGFKVQRPGTKLGGLFQAPFTRCDNEPQGGGVLKSARANTSKLSVEKAPEWLTDPACLSHSVECMDV